MIALPSGFSPTEYLELETNSLIRHEFRQGLVYAMAGGSDDHNRIAINLLTEINLHLRGSECQFFGSDVKVNYADQFYYYPDAFVTCDPRDRQDRYIKKYPRLIVEVLSSATKLFDQNEKFQDYQNIETLEEYVLISQDQQQIQCFRRQNNQWNSVIYKLGETVTLQSIQLEISLANLYRGTTLEVS